MKGTYSLSLFCFILLYVFIGTFVESVKGKDKNNYRNEESEVIIVLQSEDEDKEEVKKDDPTTNSGFFEGDIEDVNAEDVISEGRNAIIAEHKKWPGKIIPYEIDLNYNETEKMMIKSAIHEFHERTCIRFVPRTEQQKDYIIIKRTEGCSSNVGKKGGEQQVSIGKGCLHRGIIMHELMHAIGFWHEQSRGDRDEHVTILWKNIEEGRDHNFLKYDWSSIQHLNESYDLDSIMHYNPYAFSKDKKEPTIVPKDSAKLKAMGQRRGLSKVDVRKINKLYGCHKKGKEICVDDRKKCVLFSKRKYCKRYREYMQKYCRKSCGFCKVL